MPGAAGDFRGLGSLDAMDVALLASERGSRLRYELTYKQPYEYDEDSPSGIGDHAIGWATHTCSFEASSDVKARKVVEGFLLEGSVLFDHYLDGDGRTYYRQEVKLVRVQDLGKL